MTIRIIAEAAQGFEGSEEQAHLLIRAAASAGADAIKFQLVYADELSTVDYVHYGIFHSLEMSDNAWRELKADADGIGIDLYLDVFGEQSLRLASELGARGVKIHPTDIANHQFLEAVASADCGEVLLGAGGAYRSELESALLLLEGKELTVLFGFQSYPTPTAANQVARIRHFVDGRMGLKSIGTGFADHADPGDPLRIAIAAMALGAGAGVIEKHITLGRVMKLEDYESALNPDEFAEFVCVIRGCSDALGEVSSAADFGMLQEEKDYRAAVRRQVVANRDLPAGHVITQNDVALKRTSMPNALADPELVYGRQIPKGLIAGSPISDEDVESPVASK